jgi:hypothetical protein
LRKIFITCVAGGGTYVVTTVFDQQEMLALMLSAFVGGVTLVVQFLREVEARQGSVDHNLTAFGRRQEDLSSQLDVSVKTRLDNFNRTNAHLARIDAGPLEREPVVELLKHIADLGTSAPTLAHRLAEAEISNASTFIKGLGAGHPVTYEGDNWSWIYTLTNAVEHSIDATSYSARGDSEQGLLDDDMWLSALGQRYIEMQARAIQRGVTIRRIFVLETPQLAQQPVLRRICDQQHGIGIEVGLIDAATASIVAPGSKEFPGHIPLIMFDHQISLDFTTSRFPSEIPGFIKTTMVLNPYDVRARPAMINRLWESAKKYEST